MPPQLALFLCNVFVIFLLWLDHKKAPSVSLALWIPTLWILLIAGKPLGIWFGNEGNYADGSPLDRIFLSGLLGFGFFFLAKRRFKWFSAIKEHLWLILLIGYMLVSVSWSDNQFTSFKRWTREELVAITMAFLVLTERDPRQAVQCIFRRSVYILIPFSLLLIKYFPHYGVEYGRWSGSLMWIGVTMQKNALGRLCIIAAFFLIWTLVRRWQGRDIPVGTFHTPAEVFLLIITLWLLKGPSGTYSATATVSFAAALITYIVLLWMKKSRIAIGVNIMTTIILVVMIFGIVTVISGGSTVSGISATLGRSTSLTGRTDIWVQLLPIVDRNPIFGGGFGSFWTAETREFYDMSDAHSGYLDVLLELGFVGILLFVMFLISFGRKTQRELTHNFDSASLSICYLIMALIYTIDESSINSFQNHLMAVILFLAVSVPNYKFPHQMASPQTADPTHELIWQKLYAPKRHHAKLTSSSFRDASGKT